MASHSTTRRNVQRKRRIQTRARKKEIIAKSREMNELKRRALTHTKDGARIEAINTLTKLNGIRQAMPYIKKLLADTHHSQTAIQASSAIRDYGIRKGKNGIQNAITMLKEAAQNQKNSTIKLLIKADIVDLERRLNPPKKQKTVIATLRKRESLSVDLDNQGRLTGKFTVNSTRKKKKK
ncbi:hypothetical protein KKG83_01930 [Candidatus Micrarchaeota archaeon]|nr:hypothetical protein [Candidatus Micrarchaeota archaeon]MBU2476209.1 hypothetical protein [Candidatus Micrarchaeota archaeon]